MVIFSTSSSGLSIDYTANKLYWISSGNGTVNRCNLDGSGLDVIDSLKKELRKATALAVMGEQKQFFVLLKKMVSCCFLVFIDIFLVYVH